MDIRSRSPDGRREAVLEYAGEIRFGPRYYYLRLLGAAILKRLFGSSLMWSSDSRFLLVQEWLSTSERDGPRTQIVVFDFLDGTECSLAKADQGFVEPLGLEGSTLRYRTSYYAQKAAIESEQELPPPAQWARNNALVGT